MDRVLCTCPSRSRPELLKNMIESFRKTKSPGTDLAIYIDNDDPRLNEYKDLLGGKYPYYLQDRMNVAQIHNYLVNENPGYDYYMPINDDIIFETEGWDNILVDTIEKSGGGWGISYGSDSTGNDRYNLPTFGMVSGRIVKALGYIYPTELLAMFGDTFLLDLGRALGKLYYCPNVVISHHKPGDIPDDWRLGEKFYKKEQRAYSEYIDNKLDRDVSKIFDIICAGV